MTFHIVTYTVIFHDYASDLNDVVDLGKQPEARGGPNASSRTLLICLRARTCSVRSPSTKTDLSKGGLLLFPKGALLNAAGTFTNASPTTNTSQGAAR